LHKFKFIDLFAGIGGFHLALHALGGECVFASEIDTYARKTYEHNIKKLSPSLFENQLFNADIRTISPHEMPDFDVLCAGFPCQPFSQAGYKRGFEDTHKSERGNLFFNIVDILQAKRPKAFFLENVRGIINHDGGKTFKIIREILEDELGYSFYFQIVQACDYGLPQLRPRAFMIGFRDEGFLKSFEFPAKRPLKMTMSDVWGAPCSRKLGFTIRVGGRGSSIEDRRNWDSYAVDGQIKRLMPEQAKAMQGFPHEFEFPVSNKEAMKQLGNSVAIDAVRECAKAMLEHVEMLNKRTMVMVEKKNKGEWTELYSFLQILHDKKITLADKNLEITSQSSSLKITKVSTLNSVDNYYLSENDDIRVVNITTGFEKIINIAEILNKEALKALAQNIKTGKETFSLPHFEIIKNKLGISLIKGGNSNQKADITFDIEGKDFSKENEGFGIKSYLGSKPTLLNASGNTNFIYEIIGLNSAFLDDVNAIQTTTKLRDRIEKIYSLGGEFKFHKIEATTMDYNLALIDSAMPELMSKMMLEFFVSRTNSIQDNLQSLFKKNKLQGDLAAYQIKIKRLLVAVLLGLFAGKKWDGKYSANGTIIVKENGEQVGFHLIELSNLEDYLFENIKFDTPSTTRHRYGSLIAESDGKIYFKLNLQLRF
jgi:DNA (cytosine-5)-methyltransferase 1